MKIRKEWAAPYCAALVIDNPTHKNALTLAMWQALTERCADLASSGARVVILRGEGGQAFSTGADISEFNALRGEASAVAGYNTVINAAMDAVRNLPMPVIAQLDRLCVGGGVALAAMADLRIAGGDCQFAIPAGRLGIAYQRPWIERIAALTGPGPVADMLLTAELFPTETAHRWGFVNRVVAPQALRDATVALAARISRLAPLPLKAAKATLAARAGYQAEREADRLIAACDSSLDYQRGVQAFQAGTRPDFRGN